MKQILVSKCAWCPYCQYSQIKSQYFCTHLNCKPHDLEPVKELYVPPWCPLPDAPEPTDRPTIEEVEDSIRELAQYIMRHGVYEHAQYDYDNDPEHSLVYQKQQTVLALVRRAMGEGGER